MSRSARLRLGGAATFLGLASATSNRALWARSSLTIVSMSEVVRVRGSLSKRSRRDRGLASSRGLGIGKVLCFGFDLAASGADDGADHLVHTNGLGEVVAEPL